MKKLIALLLLAATNAFAFDSSADYNTANMSYPANSTIQQIIVFNSTMQQGGTFVFSVDAHAGGGRPLQHDTGKVQIQFWNGSTHLGTAESPLTTLEQMDAWSAYAGDNSAPWETISVTSQNCAPAPSCANVTHVNIVMIGTDTSWWAGNYGPQWRVPTLTLNGGSNLVYNPEFGVAPNGLVAQGWTSSSGWGTCGNTGGSVMCVTNSAGVTANMHGTGYDANGGTTSGTAGGYTSTMTVSNPTGTPTTPTPPPDPNTTVVGTSSGMTATQSTTKNNAQTRRDSYWGNNIYIDQVGDSNNITIKQESPNNTVRGYANQTAQFHGSNNTVDIRQGAQGVPGKNLVELDYNGGLNNIKIYQDRYDDGSQDDNAHGNHVARAKVDGDSNTLSIIQRNNLSYPQGNYADVTITGNSNNVSTLQISDVGKNAFVNIQGNSNVVNLTQQENSAHYADIKLQGNGHNVTLEQRGTGAHRANIDLVNNGASSTVNVLQQGTTQQSYSLQQTCVASGCGATIVQGQ